MRILGGFLLLTVVALGVFATGACAVSLHPDLLERLRADGTLSAYVEDMAEARARGVWASQSKTTHLSLASSDVVDTMRIPLILIEFTDNRWQTGPDGTKSYFEDLMFSEGVLPYGSMREFYLENSYGKFLLQGEVYGWYMMPQTYDYYVDGQRGFGDYPRNAQKMVEDAVALADPYIDYSLYDNDGDGEVEGLMLVHAGEGYETSGSTNQIHSHRWFMTGPQYYDGVSLRGYAMQPEQNRGDDNLVDIGVFCHEFGHVLGLPDLYDVDYTSSGLGSWTLMASGSYNGGSQVPAHFDAWCKYQLGFIQPEVLTANSFGHEFPRVEEVPFAVRVWANGTVGPQYFLIENRQRVMFDAGLPGEGLLIYHVDENQHGNSDESHYLVALEQADGLFELESGPYSGGNSGDPWPGFTNKREFTDRSVPDSKAYGGSTTEVAAWRISDSDSLMTANLDVEFSRPCYLLTGRSFDDSEGGDGDGVSELGETIAFHFQVTNLWADAVGATATLSASDPRLAFTTPTVELGTVPSGGDAGNPGDPIVFEIPNDMDTTKVRFTLVLTQASIADTTSYAFNWNIGGTKVLIVDDDRSTAYKYELYLANALDSLGITYSAWGKDTLGSPGFMQVESPIVMWITGDARDTSLTSADRAFIADYLDGGGRLFLTGQDIAQHFARDEDGFLEQYFKCAYDGAAESQWAVSGVDGSVVGRDSISCLIIGYDGAANQYSLDILEPQTGATACLEYGTGGTAAVEVASAGYRAVLFGFGFEAVNDQYVADGFSSRETLLSRVMDFLDRRVAIICGDVDASGFVDIDDVIALIGFVYDDGVPPNPPETGDVSCDKKTNLLDIVYLVNYLFRAGAEPCAACD
jgi:immune inhibitor A